MLKARLKNTIDTALTLLSDEVNLHLKARLLRRYTPYHITFNNQTDTSVHIFHFVNQVRLVCKEQMELLLKIFVINRYSPHFVVHIH